MPRRILCVQLADVGDLILTTPALRALRDALPDASITLLTTPHAAPVVAGTGLVDDILTFDKHTFDSPRALLKPRNWRTLYALWRSLDSRVYETAVFFHHISTGFGALKFAAMAVASGAGRRVGLRTGRSAWFLNDGVRDRGFGALHQVRYWLRLAEIAAGSRANPAAFLDASLSVAESESERTLPTGRRTVAIHAGSGGYSRARRWEPEKFAAVARRLIDEQAAQIVLVGTAGDDTSAVLAAMPDHAAHTINLTGQTTLTELPAVLAQCDLFIGADSGVMHMAAASGVPVVAVFGPSNHRAWHPWTPNGAHEVVRSGVTCSPCSYVGTGVGLRDGCAARTCMRLVTADEVYDAALRLINRERGVKPQPHPEPRRDRVSILGVPVDKLSYEYLLAQIGVWIAEGERTHQLCTVNPEFVMIAQRDPNFYHILNRADLCLPDGVGLLYAARYQNNPIPMRVTGSDGVPKIAERAAQHGWRLFLLGAAEGVAARAADVLCDRYPGLHIAGTYSGSPRANEEDAIVERVNASGADILLVAYGAPQQDKWIARNTPRLNVSVAMGVGGTFDYIVGDVPLAPPWLRRAGLEWLYRLVKQPWRARRQLRLPAFVVRVLLHGRG
jgi:N-acetylglucosaminyldiphosphoundecaprenol N-acetyl-beta-D-mannosaminyltransferase